MKTRITLNFAVTGVLFFLFALLTLMVLKADVKPIGPEQSCVGLATINGYIHKLVGVNLLWYEITDWLGLAAIIVALGFAGLGVVQMISRKGIRHVDANLFILGAFYVVVVAAYIFFEVTVINYRPIIIHDGLEASFPSSHTMIVFCIMTTAIMQFRARIKNARVKTAANWVSFSIIAVTVIGRFISGVHWFTDILGGLLLGAGFVMLYYSIVNWLHTINRG